MDSRDLEKTFRLAQGRRGWHLIEAMKGLSRELSLEIEFISRNPQRMNLVTPEPYSKRLVQVMHEILIPSRWVKIRAFILDGETDLSLFDKWWARLADYLRETGVVDKMETKDTGLTVIFDKRLKAEESEFVRFIEHDIQQSISAEEVLAYSDAQHVAVTPKQARQLIDSPRDYRYAVKFVCPRNPTREETEFLDQAREHVRANPSPGQTYIFTYWEGTNRKVFDVWKFKGRWIEDYGGHIEYTPINHEAKKVLDVSIAVSDEPPVREYLEWVARRLLIRFRTAGKGGRKQEAEWLDYYKRWEENRFDNHKRRELRAEYVSNHPGELGAAERFDRNMRRYRQERTKSLKRF